MSIVCGYAVNINQHNLVFVMKYDINAYLQNSKRENLQVPLTDEIIGGMMTSSNGNIFRVTDHLCGEFTVHRWILHTKASDAELWSFLWSAHE